ncbi:degenerin mec-10-like isoform X2 [Centruroides sculpturatus]|uniref:degenerin mec-10-like isoform X2 n=1 Tax=Centruroides sculpturatus TaxID=218467 RepID=UPI000C6EC8F5|nr:degenerin mec-10-like isoform X2 [Centruroides sculpturatus]
MLIKEVCENFDYFCKKENITEEDLKFPLEIWDVYNRSIIDKYGIRKEDILRDLSDNNSTFRTFQLDEVSRQRNCYSIQPEVYMEQKFKMYDISNVDIKAFGSIQIKFNPDEMTYPGNPISVVAAIHSKDGIVNPFTSGIAMTPGNRYIVQLTPIVKTLLPSPFNTNCENYFDSQNNSFSFPRYRCLAECKKELSLKKCGCILPDYPFVTDEKDCEYRDSLNCLSSINLKFCSDKCPNSCEFTVFEYSVRKRPYSYKMFHEKVLKLRQEYATIHLIFKTRELYTYSLKPKFQPIELFGYIGGYIGIWLGISLIAVCDFLEAIFIYLYCITSRMPEFSTMFRF